MPDRYVILSGAGLSAPSGVPTFRDAGGLWEGHRVEDVATPQGWARNPALVRRFYDERRIACAAVRPNPGHEALVRLQAALGPDRVMLVTQNIDGLLTVADPAATVLEMHGSLWQLRCERAEGHPWVPVRGAQDPEARCGCGGRLRPAVVWFGEMPIHMGAIERALALCSVFVSVGTSGKVYPAAGFVFEARRAGARCVEVNPQPTDAGFHETIAESADVALRRWVEGVVANLQ